MLKVLIVDDDSIARTNIKTMIDWGKYGYEISGEASNGASALEVINRVNPDIVITDMSMPVMDGVALIEHLEKNNRSIKAIALSGYDDFEYVRQSMKKGAVDYLLKHRLNAEVLLNVLKSAGRMIITERQSNAENDMVKKQLTESLSVLRKNFIKQLVEGALSDKSEIERKISTLELQIETRNLALAVAEIDDFHFLHKRYTIKDINKLIISVEDISAEILKDTGKAVFSHINDGKFVIIFSFGSLRSDLYIYNNSVTAVDRIKVSIKRYLNITACFSLSPIFNDIMEIGRYYKETDAALKDRFFKGKNRIIKEPVQGGRGNEYFNLEVNDEKGIINALKAADKQKLIEYINGIFDKIADRNVSYKSIQMICAELINIINKIARESGFDARLVYSGEEIPFEEMKKYETITEVKQWIIIVFEKLISMIEMSRLNTNCSETAKKAIEFIQRNYSKNISLNDAAEYIGINSSYLSRVFKRDLGKGFVEYLNMIRLEHAKSLIQRGNIKLKDVVRDVGFNNYTYFFKVFKENENMTPLEYESIFAGRT